MNPATQPIAANRSCKAVANTCPLQSAVLHEKPLTTPAVAPSPSMGRRAFLRLLGLMLLASVAAVLSRGWCTGGVACGDCPRRVACRLPCKETSQ